MTDTTAPLAVTMDLIERVDALASDYDALREQLKRRASKILDEQLLCDLDLLTLETRSNDLRAVAALVRRCLEPDELTVARVLAEIDPPHLVGHAYRVEEWSAEMDRRARAAIAALVNPNGK